eukprot:3356891-Amphidinium_carterae.2
MPDAIPQPRGLESVVGTRLEPFLRGFQELGFRFDIEALVQKRTPHGLVSGVAQCPQEFVQKNAPSFAVACADGSAHPGVLWACGTLGHSI